MYKYTYIIIFSLCSAYSRAQQVSGTITDENEDPLIGAVVQELGTLNGVISDATGYFEIQVQSTEAKLVFTYLGFDSDTLAIEASGPLLIRLQSTNEALEEVRVTSSSSFVDRVNPLQTEVITESELQKAACCNLSESFETNASVDVSFADAVTGTKMIRMLGLDGRYVQINRENIPNIRGLSGRYGLSFVPGTWIQSIDVGKGAGSVVNGYESMTGQINLELKKPNSEKYYFNAYANSFGRLEFNANHARSINDKWKTAMLIHGDYLNNEIDNNNDDFMDLPKTRQVNVLNRFQRHTDKIHSQVGITFMYDEKAGGQLGFGFGDDHLTTEQYGFSNRTNRIEVFGKTGLLFPDKPYQGWGFIYSASYLDIDAGFGRRACRGQETTLYTNIIYQNIIGDTKHQYKTGASFLYDRFDETYDQLILDREEIVPGLFYEYSYLPDEHLSVVIGGRLDFHNLYGIYATPRVHIRYEPTQNLTVRGSLGRGYRTPNVIMENSQTLVSSRELVLQESIQPEETWNAGGSAVMEFYAGERPLTITADYYYTHFQNQLIYDLDASSAQLHVYNLDGKSYAHSFQIEAGYEIYRGVSLRAAYKYYDVQTTINETLQTQPFVARDRVFVNASYETKYEKWQVDATLQWYGNKRLPDTTDKSEEFRLDEYSPSFYLINAQLTRNFKWGSLYLGGENLLDFKQKTPIVDAQNPFGNQFDAALAWGPIAGRLVYGGFRYKIK